MSGTRGTAAAPRTRTRTRRTRPPDFDGRRAAAGILRTTAVFITSQDITDFTEGGCYLLAREVEQVNGWLRAAFWDGFRATGHMFNAIPDGRYLDITGPHTRTEMMASRWALPGKRHGARRGITTRYIDDWGWSCGLDEAALAARAREVVPVLLARCQPFSGDAEEGRSDVPAP